MLRAGSRHRVDVSVQVFMLGLGFPFKGQIFFRRKIRLALCESHESLPFQFRVFLLACARGFGLAIGGGKTGDGFFFGLEAFDQAE